MVNLVPIGTKTTLKGTGEGFSSWYDHIYVNAVATRERTEKGGASDVVAGLNISTAMARREVSDHLPVWAEFRTDGTDDD